MTNYIQIVEQTDEEKLKMYMKFTKEELAKMLIQANKILGNITQPYFPYNPYCPPDVPYPVYPYPTITGTTVGINSEYLRY